MRKWFSVGLSSLAVLLALPAAAQKAFAHGGQYRGPAGEVPPDSRQPEDPPPPDSGGGTPTPPDSGGGTPTPPDGGGGTPTPPDSGGTSEGPDPASGGGPTGPSGGPKTASGGKTPQKHGPSYESWLFWWNYNKDGIINLKKAIRSGGNKSGSSLTALSAGDSASENDTQDITARAIESKVVPILLQVARDSRLNFDIQASGVMGLAKIRHKPSLPLIMQIAKNDGTEQYHKVVEETAALSLGVLQERSKEVRKFLGDLATNPAAKVRTRCFAAFSLGLLGDRDGTPGANSDSLEVLKSMVKAAESNKDVHNSALVAIGLLGDPAAVPELMEWLNSEKAGANKLSDVTLSYVAAALGKIGQPGTSGPGSREVLDALAEQLKRKNRMTRYSVIIALGQIAPQGNEKVQSDCVKMLSSIIKSEGKSGTDTQSVNFAMTALGRIAGVAPDASGKGGCPVAVRDRAVEELSAAFEGKSSLRSFAALGMALLGKDLQDATVKTKLAEVIRNTLIKTNGDVEQRGAMVIALGLLKDIGSASVLQDLLQDRGLDKKLRGTAAVALGLIGDPAALDVVHKALLEKDDRELRVDTAVAAGLLKDSQAVNILVDILKDPKASQFILGSVATALGQIGDERALEPLSQIVLDDAKQYPDLTRALACVALGQIGDKSDVSVLARISEDVNYRAYYDAIGEVLTIL